MTSAEATVEGGDVAVHPLSHEGRGCVVDQREKMGPELPRHARCLGRCLFDSFLEGRSEASRVGGVVGRPSIVIKALIILRQVVNTN